MVYISTSSMLQATRLAAVLPSLGRCPTLGDEPLTEGELVLHTLARLIHRLGGRRPWVGLRFGLSRRLGLGLCSGFGGGSCWRLSGFWGWCLGGFSSCGCCGCGCGCRGSSSGGGGLLFSFLLLLAPVAVAEVHGKVGDHKVPVNGVGGGAGEVRVPSAGPSHHRFLNTNITSCVKYIILTEFTPGAGVCRCSHRGHPAASSA